MRVPAASAPGGAALPDTAPKVLHETPGWKDAGSSSATSTGTRRARERVERVERATPLRAAAARCRISALRPLTGHAKRPAPTSATPLAIQVLRLPARDRRRRHA